MVGFPDCAEGYECVSSSCTCVAVEEELACSANTDYVIEHDVNPFDSVSQTCSDDCAEGYECVASSCTCVAEETEKETLSCSSNTSYVAEMGDNPYSPMSYTCSNDCPQGFDCCPDNCICVESS